ncbi:MULTISPECIES: hypothetical protein [Sphingomonadaceae]|jgi:hypothetical protein|uniref:Uncharacterized protein n=1 Tax=Edaphosphingomonas fennica TaxID=114404 RepID=A0A2T4HJ16_9SPHN|nr:hypothetical protein [Sphingomonas fennica]MCF8708636.1 hypothetical protein [Rhizorhapis sp. SPR117]PTD15794.1 hypothetical protein CV103_21915 [Sphingomonas fennica]
MRILLTRTRIGMEPPSYSFRVYVPFTEISLERQALISMHSDYGMGAGLLARLPDVIAPMSHLESAPGLDKHNLGKRIDGVADRLGAILLGQVFPEMAERTVPFRLSVPAGPANARLFATIDNLSGRYEPLSRALENLTAEGLGFHRESDR